jgi:RNA recognition motif-containing protein
MSDATQQSQQSGNSRRRRSRGGKNRNSNNQHENRRGGDRENRGDRGDRGSRDSNRGSQSGRSEEFRPQAPRRTYAPPKLSWWQKLLQALGLYKAPAPPSRLERKPETAKPQTEARPPKSNTRNARSGDGQPPERTRERSEERPPKRERSPRNADRDRDRPRGGDGSTVESPRVYVGNLSYDVSEQDLQELFKGVGPVRNVEIVYNRSTHRSKGYGFVEMLHKDEAVRAVEVLHDQPFMGRKLMVSGAKSKGYDEREDMEGRDESAPRKVVVASIPAAVETSATQAETEAEPSIQTIVENVTEAPSEDLVSKYGFDEPTDEPKQA